MNVLLRSRSFWLAVVGVAQSFVLYYFNVPESLWLSIDALIAVVIASLTVEDAALAIREEIRAYRLALGK
ncbi:MAG TPA: hypothetical protein VMX17_13415 [Candidatus Glassbacteria bacterium]|nr:hypothetical protein [Candidatus Glassbacteria bacterium]